MPTQTNVNVDDKGFNQAPDDHSTAIKEAELIATVDLPNHSLQVAPGSGHPLKRQNGIFHIDFNETYELAVPIIKLREIP